MAKVNLKHSGAVIDQQIDRVLDGSVVVDNTLSELDETSNKPVSGAAVAKYFGYSEEYVVSNIRLIDNASVRLSYIVLKRKAKGSAGYYYANEAHTEQLYSFSSTNSFLVFTKDDEILMRSGSVDLSPTDILLLAWTSGQGFVGGALFHYIEKTTVLEKVKYAVPKCIISRDVKFGVPINKVTLASLTFVDSIGNTRTAYCNESHTEETFEFQDGALYLVVSEDDVIRTRPYLSAILPTDTILLGWDSTEHTYFISALHSFYLQYANRVYNDAIIGSLPSVVVDTTKLPYFGFYLSGDGIWYTALATSGPRGYMINISDALKVTIKSNANNGAIYAILSSTEATAGSFAKFAMSHPKRVALGAGGEEVIIRIDATLGDEKYLYVYDGSTPGVYLPEEIRITKRVDYIQEISSLRNEISRLYNQLAKPIAEGRDIPQNTGIYNAYRRAMQLKNVKWDAKSLVPNSSGEYTYAAGEHYGIPYSSVKEYDKYVGYDVSILTFVTAAHNPYSLLYTENVNGNNSKSAYGRVYKGINCGAYFGIVCNIFALYAVGMRTPYNSYEWLWLEKQGIIERIYEQDANGVMLGDLILEPGHCSIITDIYRDARGRVTTIHWSESAGSTPKTNIYNVDEFNNRMSTRSGVIYRYKDLFKNLSYEPSPFSMVDDEVASTYEFNDDICTFAGDYASFREGELIFLNYAKGDFTQCKIYKDDKLVHTLTLDANADVHNIDLSALSLPKGTYKACLSGNGDSKYTYWEVIETSVSVEGDRNAARVAFSSSNSVPSELILCDISGSQWANIELLGQDISNGYIDVEPINIAAMHRVGYALPSTCYIKVKFRGEYGAVTNGYTISI